MKGFLIIFGLLVSTILSGQAIPKDYFQFPINPGNQNYLAGTVGEIRSSHFHTGIDVKTGGAIGWPVYATAEGYISRIKISIGGYGHTLYMSHPNGTFSVYAHLDRFEDKIERRVREKQYEEESYEIELFPTEEDFKFNKGELIGYSGNTGSSSGPHLHFEIRDKDHQPMDLLKFGFSEIQDRIPPVVKKIAFVTLDQEARVNGLFGRYEFDLIKVNNAFRNNIPIQLEGRIGVEIYSYDPMDGIPNKNGIIKTIMLVDDDTLFHENKEILSFSRQRNTLQHYNYARSKSGGRRFNKLYRDDGNENIIYLTANKGVVFEEQKEIQLFTEDSYKNLSISIIEINREKIVYPPKTSFSTYELIGNNMHFKSRNGVGIRLEEWEPVSPYYSNAESDFYLWDLDNGLPSSVFANGQTSETGFIASIPSNQKISYYQEEFEINFGKRSLFDTLHLVFKKELDSIRNLELFRFNNVKDPMRSDVTITLHPERDFDQDKSAVYSVLGKKFNFMGGNWSDSHVSFTTRDLVTYTILEDSIPPEIVPDRSGTYKITDDLSGIKSYRAELNGAFLLMRYEAKKDKLIAIPLDSNIPIKGEFTLEVTDNADNTSIYTNKRL